MPRSFILPACLLCATILLAFVRIGLEDWPGEFDDAFITYRYAKNLALGHGITWNPGQPPTEGYTNFLLLIFLAPWIKAGVDPLLVTRLVSYASLCGIVVVLFKLSRQRFGASVWIAALIASIVLMAPETKHLPLTGLETVLYALFLLLTFARGIDLIERRTVAAAITFSVLLLATVLLRPEAVLLYPVIVAGFLAAPALSEARQGGVEGPARREPAAVHPLLVSLILLSAAGGVYLAWKYVHFGAFLPNPFYVKAAGGGLVSSAGLRSVRTFSPVRRRFWRGRSRACSSEPCRLDQSGRETAHSSSPLPHSPACIVCSSSAPTRWWTPTDGFCFLSCRSWSCWPLRH